jgi:hypothetical protein
MARKAPRRQDSSAGKKTGNNLNHSKFRDSA